MIGLLRRAARAGPDRAAIVTDEHTYSYGELTDRAESLAGGLLRRGVGRFAIADHDAATVISLLAAASLAGAEACQYPSTDPAEICELADRFGHDLIISPHHLPGVRGVMHPGDLSTSAPDDALTPFAARPLLVLTTGTTGAPRGVRHDWNRVLRAAHRITPAAHQRWLLCYGLHQFAGLQVLVHVAAAHAVLVAPAPRRPREGLAAMRRHAVDHASATPTYWRFLLAELRADSGPVPRLVQITLGGEAVPAPLLGALRDTFPDARISQIYAGNEFGATGSIRDGHAGLPLDVLQRGGDADVAMKIVDGELWVRSRIGMLGYYGEDPVDADGWRPTGDLVEVVDDRIEFRGRTSEIINVGGVKVHPLPVEGRVGAVPGVDLARVYGRPSPVTGAIVAVDVVAAPGADPDALKDAVRASCADLPPAARPRSVRLVDTIDTVGTKIVRRGP